MDSTALAIVLAGFGLLLILLSYRRSAQHRLWAALGHGLSGAIIFLLGALLFTVALNLNTYERWQTDQPIAQLSFEKTAPHSYRVSLMRIPSGDLQVFNLSGDEWRIQAQQLKWAGWPRQLGLQSDIRLQYLLSNGKDADNLGRAAQYTLSRNPGVDLWKLRTQRPDIFRDLTVQLLSSDSVPLTDGLRYHLYATAAGLNARAINQRSLNVAPRVAEPAIASSTAVHSSTSTSKSANLQTPGATVSRLPPK